MSSSKRRGAKNAAQDRAALRRPPPAQVLQGLHLLARPLRQALKSGHAPPLPKDAEGDALRAALDWLDARCVEPSHSVKT